MGLTQQEAEGRGAAYITSTYNYSDTAYGAPIEDHDGFVKVLTDHETEEILGCHIIGTDAATLIQEVANATRSCAGVDAILQSIYVHPLCLSLCSALLVDCPCGRRRSVIHEELSLWNWE